MRNLVVAFVFILSIFFIDSCKKDTFSGKDGQVQFSLSQSGLLLKSSSTFEAKSIVISIKNDKDSLVYNTEIIELIKFNDYYLSKPISLKPGNYKLVAFHVIDENKNILYATPFSGSAKAYLIKETLPIGFQVQSDKVSKLIPEVLGTANCLPSEFGYTTFPFCIVKTIDFFVSVFIYNPTSKNFELTNASIKVTGDEPSTYIGNLEAVTNKVTVRDGSTHYTIEINKDQYKGFKTDLTADSLKKLIIKPLIVILKLEDVTSGLVAYYPFNGNAKDSTGNGNNGVIHGAMLSADKNGKANSAYYFDGNNSYIDIGNSPMIKRYANSCSVAFWINLNSFSSSYCSIIISNRNQSNYSGSMIEIAGNLSLQYKQVIFYKNFQVTSDSTTAADFVNSVSQLELYNWHHVCVTYKYNGGYNNIVKTYIDGQLTASKTTSATIDPGNSKTFIGCEPTLSPIEYSLKGSLDEVRIYNRVLADSEVNRIYSLY